MMDPRRPRKLSARQLQELRQDARIQELRGRQRDLFERIRKQFNYIYRAKGQPIHDEYEQIKRDIDRALKGKMRALKSQLQANYDADAPMQDMLAQMAVGEALPSPVKPPPAPAEYAFEERARIAQALVDPPSSPPCEGALERQIAIVDDLVSLCARQERRPRHRRQTREGNISTGSSDDEISDVDIKLERSDSTAPSEGQSGLRCHPFRCLCCLGDAALPSCERNKVFGSKYSLERHFNRHHRFQPGRSCPLPIDEECTRPLDDLMLFKNHAKRFHGIEMSDRC